MTKIHTDHRHTEVFFNPQLSLWVVRWQTVTGQIHVRRFIAKSEAEDFARETDTHTLSESQRIIADRR